MGNRIIWVEDFEASQMTFKSVLSIPKSVMLMWLYLFGLLVYDSRLGTEIGVRFYMNGAEVCIAQVPFLANFTIRKFSMWTECERHTSLFLSFSHGAYHNTPCKDRDFFRLWEKISIPHAKPETLYIASFCSSRSCRSILISNPLKGDRIVDIPLAGRRYRTLLDMLLVALVTALSELEWNVSFREPYVVRR